MYCPASFRQDDQATLIRLIRDYPLGTLFTAVNGLEANPIPFLLSETPNGLVLEAHLARANSQVDALRQGGEVLVVFSGPDAYITPNWYPGKAIDGKQVPTWNYTMVQVKGRVTVREDAAWIHRQISALTHQQEASQPTPWAVTDAPADYIATQMKALIGIEIAVDSLKGKFKLSQNRQRADFQGVIQGLGDNHPVSQAMQPLPPSTKK